MHMKQITHVVSVSTGKDSLATARLCLDRHPAENVRLVMADTGNEHESIWPYLDYLREVLDHEIDVIHADFSADIARKRAYVATKWVEEGVSLAIVARALAVLQPTGNPFLDLCIWKGRFPSRRAQFCTQFLKRDPLNDYQSDLVLAGHEIEVWLGIRRDESTWRAAAVERDRAAEGWWVNRPIIDWTAQQVVDFLVTRNLKLNPLYYEGFSRVGCAICINASKAEIALWSRRHPEVIDRLREWEHLVTEASKRGAGSFFPAPADGRGALRGSDIDSYVTWSLTKHGGKEADPDKIAPLAQCSSVYGLCE